MRRRWAVMIAVWGMATVAAAQDKLSLAAAMQRARARAGEVVAAQSRAEAAQARTTQARAFRLPSIKLEEMWISTDSPAEAFALRLNQERFAFADFMNADPNRPNTLDTAITRLEVSMPLYTGGELAGRIAQAQLAADAARSQQTWAGNMAALAAADAYVMLDQAQELASLLERARDTVKAHVELARAYVDEGMLVRSELLRAEVELARVEDLLEEARGRVRVAGANLAYRLGVEQTAVFELDPLPAPAPLDEELRGWLASAAERQDLAAARQLLRAGELEEGVRRAAFLPRIGVVARGDLVDDSLFGGHGGSTAVMAVASLNLFAGGADRAAAAAARFDAGAGRADVQRFEEGVRLEVQQAYEQAATARARHLTAGKALAAAREAERITEERFRTGVVKMLDLLDASTARREAETRELVARAEAHAASLRLAVRAGRAPESVVR
ncbi:MAG: TolC family protein [Acidobacteriota bacterium]